MTSRRDFLRKTTIALAGGLIVGDAAMELFERLTHRKVWMGTDFPPYYTATDVLRAQRALNSLRDHSLRVLERHYRIKWELAKASFYSPHVQHVSP